MQFQTCSINGQKYQVRHNFSLTFCFGKQYFGNFAAYSRAYMCRYPGNWWVALRRWTAFTDLRVFKFHGKETHRFFPVLYTVHVHGVRALFKYIHFLICDFFCFTCKPELLEFFLALSICHTVHATKEEDTNSPYPYHYQVPDYFCWITLTIRVTSIFFKCSGCLGTNDLTTANCM